MWSVNFNFFPLIKASRSYSRLDKDYLITKLQLLQPSPFPAMPASGENKMAECEIDQALRVKSKDVPALLLIFSQR